MTIPEKGKLYKLAIDNFIGIYLGESQIYNDEFTQRSVVVYHFLVDNNIKGFFYQDEILEEIL